MTGSLPAVGVCGYPRSGSSMRMAMLDAGGIPPVPGSDELSYELTGPIVLDSDQWWSSAPGHAVKLLDNVLWGIALPTSCDWRFIWSDRDPIEQARSTVKFMSALKLLPADAPIHDLVASFHRDREHALELLSDRGDVLVLSYEETLTDPLNVARRISAFVDPLPFDPITAAAVVHDRAPACAPGLDFELGRST